MTKRYVMVTTTTTIRTRYAIEMPDGEDDPIPLLDYITTGDVPCGFSESDIGEQIIDNRIVSMDELVTQFHQDTEFDGQNESWGIGENNEDYIQQCIFVPPKEDYMKTITIGITPASGATIDIALGEALRVIKMIIDKPIIHNPPDTGLTKTPI